METDLKNIKFLVKRNFVILGIVLLIGGFALLQTMTKEVIIKDMDKQIKVKVAFANVEGAIKKGNIKLHERDQVSKSLESKITDGMVIEIERAYPVEIHVDGKTEEIMTANKKVEDILNEYDITMKGKDKVEPALDANINEQEEIKIIRVNEKIITEKLAIPYESVIKNNDKLEKGKINVIKKGKYGQKEVKYTAVYEDGIEVSRQLKEENILKEAESEVVEKGTAFYIATARGAMRVRKKIRMSATAYDLSFESCGKRPGDPYYGMTRSGTKARPGVVAVDPRVIPLGSKLYIKSLDGTKDYGFASAEDTGGAIKGKKIDLFFKNSRDVKRYGRRKVEVYVLK